MFTGLAAAGLGVLGGLAGSFLSRNARREEMRRAEALSWQQWHANNAYNHPKNQMARFREAGLNPNLVYGHMPIASGPTFVGASPVENYDLGFDKLASSLRADEAFDVNLRSMEHAMALQDANLELAKQSSLRSDREINMRSQLLPLQEAEIASRIALNNAHRVAVKEGKYDIFSTLADKAVGDVKEAGSTWSKIFRHKGVRKAAGRVLKRLFNLPSIN